jgi:hypothetical protein
MRWMDSVIADLATMGIRGWRTKVADRDAWRTVVNEAKTFSETSLNMYQTRWRHIPEDHFQNT